jgi:hypothetical protein
MSVEQPPLKSGVSHSDAMVSDLRVTLRGFAAAPWFAVTVAATLALGIGAATAVFSVVYAVLWRPLPFAQVDRVLMLGEFSAASESRLVAPLTFDDWRTRQTAFSEIAAFRYWETVNLEDQMADPEPVTLTTGTDNLFRALGVTPIVGRTYREEQNPNGGSEAVLSYVLWQRRYRGDPTVVGRVISIRGTATMIVGIMPPLPRTVATGWGGVWTCLYRYNIAQQRATGYRSRYLNVVGRLAPEVSIEQATTRMRALQRQLWTESTSVAVGFDVWLTPLADVALRGVRVPMLVVSAAVFASRGRPQRGHRHSGGRHDRDDGIGNRRTARVRDRPGQHTVVCAAAGTAITVVMPASAATRDRRSIRRVAPPLLVSGNGSAFTRSRTAGSQRTPRPGCRRPAPTG